MQRWMNRPARLGDPARLLALALALSLTVLVVSCADDDGGDDAASTTALTVPTTTTAQPTTSSGPAADQPWSEPGLVDQDGEPIEVLPPEPASGRQLDITDFGADPDSGSDDAKAIRDALDEAEPGDAVIIPEGVFELRSPDPAKRSAHLVIPSGVHLLGAGFDRTALVSSFDGDDDSVVILAEAVENVILSGFTITSTYEGSLGSDPRGDGDAGGGPMFGIKIGERDGQGSARLLVEDIRVERFERHGISLKATRKVIVRDCHVADATSVGTGGRGYGIAVEGRADQRDPTADNDSRHNVVVDNLLDGRHLRHAILLQFPTHNNLIADNLIMGSVLDAIDLHGEGEYLNEIRGNTVLNGKRAAIALGNSGGSTHAHSASGEGNWVHRNSLIGNEVGVLVILGTPDTIIEANRIVTTKESDTAVRVDDGPGTTVRRNTIVMSDDSEPFDVDDPEIDLTRNWVQGEHALQGTSTARPAISPLSSLSRA